MLFLGKLARSRTGRLAASAGSSAPQGSHHTQDWQCEVPSEDIVVTDLKDDSTKWGDDKAEQNCSLVRKSLKEMDSLMVWFTQADLPEPLEPARMGESLQNQKTTVNAKESWLCAVVSSKANPANG